MISLNFGSSGQIYSKKNLLKALSEENNSSIAMLNPQLTQLDNYVILLIYIAKKEGVDGCSFSL